MPLPILMVVASEDDGGMARVVLLLAKHLPAFDIDVRVAVHREAPLTGWLRAAGVEFDVVPELLETPTRPRPDGRSGLAAVAGNLLGLSRAVSRIRELGDRHGSRILYSHNTWSHYVCAFAARRTPHSAPGTAQSAPRTSHAAPGTRVVPVWHIHNDHSRPLTRVVDRAAMRVGHVAAFAAVSRSIGQPFEGLSAPLTVVTNGIDRSVCERASSAPLLRARLGLDANAVVVAYAGRLVAHKGIHVLTAAARAALPQVPNLHVVVLGGTPRHAADDVLGALRARAQSWGLADRLHMPGHVEEVERYVADADVAVVPSTCADGYPLAAIEALCLGVPVIASAIGGLPEIVRDGVDGVLVPPGDVVALADAMVSLARQPDQRLRMARAARDGSRDRFDAAQMARRVAAVLHAAAGAPPGEA
jgi:glycosyltransferase involved in cell wall biosynthesis